jgi:glycosyltransferase involved in cell wall biosynthesis
MRLLFLSDRFAPEIGGLATSARRLAGHLTRLGHEVTVLALAADLAPGRAESQLADTNLTLHRLAPYADETQTLPWVLGFVERLHRRHRFTAIWGHAVNRAGFLAAWAGRQLGLPYLLALRGDDFDRLAYPPGDFARLEWCLRGAAAVSAVAAELAVRAQVVAGKPVVVLPNAVDCERFQPGPRPADLALRHDLHPGDLVLGFSGELRASKGMIPLLDAFVDVRKGCRCRLLIIGDVPASERREFLRVTGQPSLEQRDVIRTGHLAEPRQVARHLLLCDVVLQPSLREGLPNSLLEAMACGIPVLASTAGGMTEVIRDGHNGLLVPVTRLDLLAPRLRDLLSWPAERRQSLGQAARVTVQQRFTPDRERAALEELLAGIQL